ncbi:MAG: protein kinase [Rhodospirillaceae bacterium]|nr:protein kinase [Rhodospirillaceae bacterium]
MTRSDTTEVARRRNPTTDTARIGTIIEGRYRLEALIGRGGMGVVYRAAHMNLRKQVAIKVLHPSLAASPEVRSRFEREALAIGKIEHPNCVGVFDFGTMDDGALYLVMELLDGKSLGDVLDEEGQLAPTRALPPRIRQGSRGGNSGAAARRESSPRCPARAVPERDRRWP